ncbi:cyclin dependent kinase (Pho85) [Sporothrix brasiliensis 5110]|uniref:Cyclin dependent kinase (Pho85) n=1 Tax=Sporothrix brasiliensis 5110 TaxID=1398154 RepID=A0A0C2J6D4_9PEZI|nr:cyclin dependent kinase (Pho85) [Sporothrix brasiliensis 5110]KIH94535.1 cyclin dependent kinase (Pho85) [Sporothrix brasiliensis 5110]
MKFGRNLPRNQVPEWASSYIDYKGLKKLIRSASETAERGETADLAEFFFALDRNLEDVDSFYNKKFADIDRRLRLLQGRYGTSPDVAANLDQDEIEELMGALLELRSQLRNLQWFGEINRRGFVKITKKLDKKVPNTTTQHRYIATKVDPCPFARDTTIARVMARVNRWLLALGDANQVDDARSERSVHSLGRASTKAMLNLSSAVLEQLNQAIQTDDVKSLEAGLRESHLLDLGEGPPAETKAPALERSYSASSSSSTMPSLTSAASSHSLLLNLLQRAISVRSKETIRYLLSHIPSLDEPDDINQRTCIHRLVIHIGRSKSTPPETVQQDTTSPANPKSHINHYSTQFVTPATSPMPVPRASSTNEARPLEAGDPRVQLLTFLLDNLSPAQRLSLSARDSFGRMPLHYAAQFGFVVVCQTLMSRMQLWGQYNVANGIDSPEWQDNEGYTPLHLSVIGGHPLTTKALLDSEDWQGVSEHKSAVRKTMVKSSAVLAIATKHNHFRIVQMLVDAGVDLNWQDEIGETALHIAARFGHDECAKILLKGSETQKADLELAEKSYAWTALHIAAVDGHIGVARLVVEAGADVDKADSSGWTAREHAALRGHLDIARLLLQHSRAPPGTEASVDGAASGTSSNGTPPTADPTPNPTPAPLGAAAPLSSAPPSLSTSPDKHSSLGDRRSNGASRLASAHDAAPPPQPVRTYGHRYLTDESLVLVSLGSMDMRKSVEAVKLDDVPLTEAHQTQLDTALSVVVSAVGATGEPSVIDLPVQENISTEPIVFTTRNPSGVRFQFDIVPTYSGNEKNRIGRGVALLAPLLPDPHASLSGLQRDVSVPIQSADFDVIGKVNFNFLVVTPFTHPKMGVRSEQTYWKKVSSTPMVIGHRGLGKNSSSNRSLQLGENTVPSFIAAANLGANYVEFDVQLTKDHVPVIYHDFLVSETGLDVPVHTLTLDQFLHINGGNDRSSKNSGGRTSSGHADGVKKGDGAADAGGASGSRPQAAVVAETASGTLAVVGGGAGGGGVPTVHFDTSVVDARSHSKGDRKNGYRLPRRAMSMSMDDSLEKRDNLNERMKHTRDFKAKGFKANSRGNFIQAPFATLEDLFKQLPPSVGFNIEMKYPMFHESQEQGMEPSAVELNIFCDTVLKTVYDLANGRDIIFSSFNPDICLCLSSKQPNFPILFLTDAGGAPVGDIRASSLQEAIRFTRRWKLLGLVSLADPFVISPRLVRVVKQNGLVCVSYGAVNNQPEMVEKQRQVKEGIDAVIVDSVLAIRKGLTKEEATTSSVVVGDDVAESTDVSGTKSE